MKFTAAYYLLLLYSTVMFGPLISLTQDVIEHTFAKAYHIAVIHAKYGNNHLEKEIATESDGQTKNSGTVKQEEFFAVHLFVQTAETRLISTDLIKTYIFLNEAKIPVIHLDIDSPPPKFTRG